MSQLLLLADHANSNGARLPFVQRAANHSSRIKTKLELRELLFFHDFRSDLGDVVLGAKLTMWTELYSENRVHRSCVGGKRGRPVRDDTDLGNNHLQIAFADGFTNQTFRLSDVLFRLLDSQTAGAAHDHFKCAGIDFRKEFFL